MFYGNVPAQKSLIYFKVGIPHNVGNTQYTNWDGILNLGFQYSHLRKKNLYFNVYLNYDRLRESSSNWSSTQHVYKIGLGFQYHLELSKSTKMYPKFGVGYAYQSTEHTRYESARENSGLNLLIDLDLFYKVFEEIYFGIGMRYDFVRLAEPSYPTSTGYYTHIHTLIPMLQILIII
jgi:outer membrane receptor protein involved in Fe transport